ncbi:L-threonylcarbamoyladenylate synthase [Fictibacillus enclensis]|uniref:L-threonylcarbamoyladenylate synthase n=1 Tax=Fictibacillus enclensis TaxID=1017270 RepID=UPI0025A1238C|nr:L-threonylcarbamoyladenylate synthase [Fictibacillus enclensis]MDM5340812.1 L-threonylcarbamoyladenylate synthase [Fictibacillus enclensis]
MKEFTTNIWSVDKESDSLTGHPQIIQASLWIKNNEVIAFPTETVYGLGGNAESDEAIDKIFAAKGRPSDNPLIVHISSLDQLEGLVAEIPKRAQMLMEAFWPGPLTLVLPKGEKVARRVTAGLSTVGVRMPDHPVALELISESGLPLAAPSANISGRPSPTTAQHVYEDLKGRIAGILDGGPTGVGVESTVVDCTSEKLTILRPGGVTREQLEEVAGETAMDPGLVSPDTSAPKSPGMKYTHYAPNAPLYLVDGSPAFIQKLVDKEKAKGRKTGVLSCNEHTHLYQADTVIPCGSHDALESVAYHLYDALRAFNESEAEIIFSEVFPKKGMGTAIMNRLEKSAGGKIITE